MSKRIQGLLIGLVIAVAIFATSNGIRGFSVTQLINAYYDNIKIIIDGKEVIPKDVNGNKVEPFISGGTTYIPLRAIGEAFGYDINYNGDLKTVNLVYPVPGGKPGSETIQEKEIVYVPVYIYVPSKTPPGVVPTPTPIPIPTPTPIIPTPTPRPTPEKEFDSVEGVSLVPADGTTTQIYSGYTNPSNFDVVDIIFNEPELTLQIYVKNNSDKAINYAIFHIGLHWNNGTSSSGWSPGFEFYQLLPGEEAVCYYNASYLANLDYAEVEAIEINY